MTKSLMLLLALARARRAGAGGRSQSLRRARRRSTTAGPSPARPRSASTPPGSASSTPFIAPWPKANIHAVVVVRNGKLVMERYFAGEDERWGDQLGRVHLRPRDEARPALDLQERRPSLLVGIALSEGKFPALDSPVFDAFPDYADLRTPGEGAHHLPRSADHVVGPGVGREPCRGTTRATTSAR